MNIQAPPNLNPGALAEMIAAGINDWGGVSPVTPDHVNPERPWPALDRLAEQTAAAGKLLVERLAIYPAYARDPERWLDPALRTAVLRAIDAEGLARPDDWVPGAGTEPPTLTPPSPRKRGEGGAKPLSRTAGEGASPRSGRVRGSSRRCSTGPRPERRSAKPTSCGSSRRAARTSMRCAGPPTSCGNGSTATWSAMS